MTTRIAIVGYGNVGRGVHKAISKNNKLFGDIELTSIVSRDPDRVYDELNEKGSLDVNVLNSEYYRGDDADVAILCGGSANDLPKQGPHFAQYLSTVDSFDTHAKIPEYFEKMHRAAKMNDHVSIISIGWDPGTFSLERTLADAFVPGVKPYGFYGLGEDGGLSMGHSDAIRGIEGVKDARQYTHAIPEAIERVRSGENPSLEAGDMHWRECVVVAEDGADKEKIAEEVKTMPNYFEPYKTTVEFVSQKELDEKHSGMPHDGLVIGRGETGDGNKAIVEYKNQWESNPEATANVLVAYARAAHRLDKENRVGAYTILDIPPAYASPRSKKELLKDFM